VFGVNWCSLKPILFATGCMDRKVRIFDYNFPNPLRTFEGHTNKIFNVLWNPTIEGLLASGSDDQTIRLYKYKLDDATTDT